MKLKEHISVLPFIGIYLVLFFATSQYPFFWDTVQLASKHATWIYESGFKSKILIGEIPSLGFYLAGAWKLFDRSLFVSHIIMLPFVLGIIFQVSLLVKKLFPKEWQFIVILIILSDPTLMAQCTLVSPDVMLVFFFLMAMNNGIFGKNNTLRTIALTGLALTSLRGIICLAGLFAADIIVNIFSTETRFPARYKHHFSLRNKLEIILPYFPAVVITAVFLLWHYSEAGWIGYHKGSNWAALFEPVNLKGILRNILIIGWRLTDFGRISVWLAGIFCVVHFIKFKPATGIMFRKLIVLFLVIFLILSFPMIIHKNLLGHRYLLPVYLLFSLIVIAYILEFFQNLFVRKALPFIIIAGLLTGNLWVYPDKIAQGWDASLAYLPYFPLREKMMKYMEDNSIATEETGSAFPNLAAKDYISLNGDRSSFAEKNLSTNKYIFWSNIFNDFSDDEIDKLQKEWLKVKEFRCMNVKLVLFKNPFLSRE